MDVVTVVSVGISVLWWLRKSHRAGCMQLAARWVRSLWLSWHTTVNLSVAFCG